MKVFRMLVRHAKPRIAQRWLFKSAVSVVLVPAVMLAILISAACAAEPGLSVKQFEFRGILATRTGDDTLYMLVGAGFLRALSSHNEDLVVTGWIASHPDAEMVPVDTATRLGPKLGMIQYVWIRSGEDFLNLALVREGVFEGAVMIDPAGMFAGLPPQVGISPAEIPHRLVSDEQYLAFIQRVVDEEALARKELKGIWSDQFKQTREDEGIQ